MIISPGSVQHVENMEKMSEEAVVNCLHQGRFDGEQLKVYRGVKNSMFLFNDEQQLKTFLSYTEDMKENCALKYSLEKSSPILDDLVVIWRVNKNFKGSYLEDYRTLNNSLPGVNVRTAWRDKYITAVYRIDEQCNERELKRVEFQPIPDYIRWIETAGELHYLSFERLKLLDGSWSETPGLFRPQRLLDLLFSINPYPLEDMYQHFATIAWLPEETIRKYFSERQENMREERKQDVLREKWRQHPLYAKKVEDLRSLCKKEGLPTKGLKHHLVELLVKSNNEEDLDEYNLHYNGDLGSIPTTVSELLKYSVARLRHILNYHGIQTCGTKEEIVLRLLLVSQNRYYLCFKKEEEEILRTVSQAEDIILEEKRQIILHPQYLTRKRTYTKIKCSSRLDIPPDLSFHNLQDVFQQLKEYLTIERKIRRKNNEAFVTKNNKLGDELSNIKPDTYEEYFCIGRKIKVKWSKDEIGNSGWKTGWYCAQVQEGHIEEDDITIVYYTEPECVYTLCVSESLALGKLKLA